MDDTTKLLWAVLIANIVALNFRIIWEWLKGRKNGGVPVSSTCPVHGTFQEQLQQLEDCVNQLKREEAAKGAAMEVELKNINKQLESIDSLKDTVTDIRVDIATILVEIKKKENNG